MKEKLFQLQGSRLVPACDPKTFSLLWRSTEAKPDWQHSAHDGQILKFPSSSFNINTQNSSCPIPCWQSSPPSFVQMTSELDIFPCLTNGVDAQAITAADLGEEGTLQHHDRVAQSRVLPL